MESTAWADRQFVLLNLEQLAHHPEELIRMGRILLLHDLFKGDLGELVLWQGVVEDPQFAIEYRALTTQAVAVGAEIAAANRNGRGADDEDFMRAVRQRIILDALELHRHAGGGLQALFQFLGMVGTARDEAADQPTVQASTDEPEPSAPDAPPMNDSDHDTPVR